MAIQCVLVESEFVFNPSKERVAKKDRTAPGVNAICAEWEHRQYKNVEFSVVSEDVSDHIGSYRNFEPMLGCYFYKVLREWASENDWKPKFLEHMEVDNPMNAALESFEKGDKGRDDMYAVYMELKKNLASKIFGCSGRRNLKF